MTCPCCGNTTDAKLLKKQFKNKESSEKLLAVIWDHSEGKQYKKPTSTDLDMLKQLPEVNMSSYSSELPKGKYAGFGTPSWGITNTNQMFSSRQLFLIQTIIEKLHFIKENLIAENTTTRNNYAKAIVTYLGILIDRIVARSNSFTRWHIQQDTVEHPFSRQAIQMTFDYPEMNIFANFSGGAIGQLDAITAFINENCSDTFYTFLSNASSGDKEQFDERYLTSVITDPPYFDAIAYADLSDFFYVWLKNSLFDLYPENFSTPQTPKTEECTALKHHHNNDYNLAKKHFENKLLEIFDAIEHQTSDIVSIMFAHQSTEAWTTLCNSILGAGMNINGSWAIDTELKVRMASIGSAALQSSVTVSCKPAQRQGYGDYKDVREAIEKSVREEVAMLYKYGFRGADLLTACFGKAVGEFGRYERVEKADGSEVTVEDLLKMTRESAFNALLKGFDGDDFTKFYIGWLELYGFTESDFDDAAKFAKVGLTTDVGELFDKHIFIKNGNKQSLADYIYRDNKASKLGDAPNSPLIDKVHKAMGLYKNGNRNALLSYIGTHAASPDTNFWRVLTSLDELLPKGMDDQKQVAGLLENKDNLIRESQSAKDMEQKGLFE